MKNQPALLVKPSTNIPSSEQALTSQKNLYKKAQLFKCISNNSLANYIIMPIWGLFWVGGYIYSNEQKVSPIETNFTRYIIQIFTQFIIVYYRRENFDFFSKRDFRLLLIRSFISGVNGLVASFFQMYLPLTVYYTISSSTTIFTFLLNYLIYGVEITKNQLRASIVAFIGIILVINGRAIYQIIDQNYTFQSSFDYSTDNIIHLIILGIGVVVWSLVWAYAIIVSGKHHANLNQFILINSIMGYYTFSLLQSTIYIPEHKMIPLFTRQPQIFWKVVIFSGIPLAISNYIFNLGMFISHNTGVTTMVCQLTILYVYVFSSLKYGQDINYFCLLGAVLLVGSIYVVLFRK